MRTRFVLASVAILAFALVPAVALNQQFNWLPCGTIDVGVRTSEGVASYESVGSVQKVTLGYRGLDATEQTGRLVEGPEQFVIRPASWRFGPAPAHLVICRTVDTENVPGTLTVQVGGQTVGEWTIKPPAGPRRLYDAVFVIPRTVFPDGKPPVAVPVTITGAEPNLSLGYRFYSTQDWDILTSPGGDLQAALAKAVPVEQSYLQGLLLAADHDWAGAVAQFEAVLADDSLPMTAPLKRLARFELRRSSLRAARMEAATGELAGDFDTHYQLGLLASAWGCWDDALAEYDAAVKANAAHADATYRLAEAMEYNRLPVEEFAPIYERAGMLGQTGDCNVEHVLVAIHPEKIPGFCKRLSQRELDFMQRNWRYVEQMLFGAAMGAWKLETTYTVATPGVSDWVMQAGWIFAPPDKVVPVQGQFGYSIGGASYDSSHSGGMDCGINGAGGAQIGATRGWEVWMHEWNHQFDWISVYAESTPGYPVTHDSDGCGKQPIVSMGCGHRSSMHYYLDRAAFRRHRAADPVVPEAIVSEWALGPVVPLPDIEEQTAEQLADWLVANGQFTAQQIEDIKREWEGQRKAEQDRVENPPPVPAYPSRKPVPDWHAFLRQRWNNTKLLGTVADADEAAFVQGATLAGNAGVKAIAAGADFVDLRAASPTAPEKCVGYARTFVYSPVEQEVRLWLGINDCGLLWLNGRQLTSGEYYACAKWEDQNRPYMLAQAGVLKRGWNCLAAKVERGGGDWGFSIHIVDFNNAAVSGLKVSPELPAAATCQRYTPPAVGPHYRWDDVKDDYLELLPRLGSAELAELTGIDGLTCDPHYFLLNLPEGTEALPGSRLVETADTQDTSLNNYLNWDLEAVAALRYEKGGEVHDLLLVRPEFFGEFLTMLQEPAGTWAESKPVNARLLGYAWLDEARYDTTPNQPHTARAALVLDTMLGEYPAEGLDLLMP